MTIWRPAPTMLVKAIGLVWREGRLLASEVRSDDGSLKGVRPLGGRLEFGESWQNALIREFNEELGIEITIAGAPRLMENIYTHEGQTGHEILFVADVRCAPGALGAGPIDYAEDNGVMCWANWFDVGALDTPGQPALFPAGLKDNLTTGHS